MRSVRISAKHARTALRYLEGDEVSVSNAAIAAATALREALAVKPAVQVARKVRNAKRLSRNEETAAIRAAVISRAKGCCESCGLRLVLPGAGEMDHFAGRVRQRQSLQWCWWLCRDCHRAKTDNMPDGLYWFQLFLKHAQFHGYREAANYALNHIEAEELIRKAADEIQRAREGR